MESNVPVFILFLGRFHPLVVHLPIGFLVFAFLLEIYGRWQRNPASTMVVGLALFSGAISALVASILGYMLSLGGDYEQDMLDTHFWFGIATTIMAFFAWAMHSGKLNIPKVKGIKFNLASLSLVVLLVSVTGHYGGNLTHGSDYLIKYVPFGRTEKVVLPPIAKLEEAEVYAYLVRPILEVKCNSCHNSNKKKGGLSFQDSIAFKKGGKNGEAFIAGNPDNSEMMRRVMLDPHHEDYMPPEGKTPLTDEEKLILSFWIEKANADFKVKLADLETPEDITSIASNMLGMEDITRKSGIPLPNVEAISEEILRDIEEAGFKIRELVFGTGLYEVVLPPESVTSKDGGELDVKLEKLVPLKDNILWLSLKDNKVRDDHLKTIGRFVNLQKLEIEKNPITDVGIAELTGIQSMIGLNLYQTKITASSFENFLKMKGLKRVYVWGTTITADEVASFRAIKNSPEIIMGM